MQYAALTHEDLTLNEGGKTFNLLVHVSYALKRVSFCGKEINAHQYLPGTEVIQKLEDRFIVAAWRGLDSILAVKNECDFSHNCHGFAFSKLLGQTLWINELNLEHVLHEASPLREVSREKGVFFSLLSGVKIEHSGRIENGALLSKIGCRKLSENKVIDEFKPRYQFDSVKYFAKNDAK